MDDMMKKDEEIIKQHKNLFKALEDTSDSSSSYNY